MREIERLWRILQVGSCGSRTFPLIKKETMRLGIPNLWNLENHKGIPQGKYLEVRRNFRSVCLDQEYATTLPCKSVMSELSHLVTISPAPTWPKDWKSREGERRKVAEMDTSALPGRFPGPQQGRGKHWIGWIWDGADTWLTWTLKPRVIEWLEWLQGDAGNEDAVECGWWQPLQEDEPFHLCICYGLNLCVPQKFHMMKSWFPWLWHP